MTLWGALLLVVFLVLGLSSRFAGREPMRILVVVVALVLVTMRVVAW